VAVAGIPCGRVQQGLGADALERNALPGGRRPRPSSRRSDYLAARLLFDQHGIDPLVDRHLVDMLDETLALSSVW